MSDHKSAPTTIDSEVEEELDTLWECAIELEKALANDEYTLQQYMEEKQSATKEAAHAITNLIAQEANKARIDELLYLTNHCDPLILDRVWVQNRIAQLTAEKGSNYEVNVDLNKSQPILKANEYQCAYCRQVFEYGWSDEEAQAEYEANFPVSSKIDTSPNIVCDDCYREMTGQLPPLQYEAEVIDLASEGVADSTDVSNPQYKPKDPQAELREALSQLKDVDSYRNGANYLSEETIDEILALFQTQEQQLLTELLGELPEEEPEIELSGKTARYMFVKGFNDCRNQVVSVIERYREGL